MPLGNVVPLACFTVALIVTGEPALIEDVDVVSSVVVSTATGVTVTDTGLE